MTIERLNGKRGYSQESDWVVVHKEERGWAVMGLMPDGTHTLHICHCISKQAAVLIADALTGELDPSDVV